MPLRERSPPDPTPTSEPEINMNCVSVQRLGPRRLAKREDATETSNCLLVPPEPMVPRLPSLRGIVFADSVRIHAGGDSAHRDVM